MAKKTLPRKITKAIREYLKILKKEGLPIQKVYLFGSWAKSKAKKWSDLDLCIISPRFKNSNEALDYLWKRRIVNKNVHIEPFGWSPKDFVDEDPLVWEIKKTGKEIKV
jgi:predicted nucleotidyltransferase